MTESAEPPRTQPQLATKRSRPSPTVSILVRFAVAIGLVLINWALVVVESSGYTDSADGHVSVTDALYYTTVTLTTTGYGDITPATDTARLVNSLVVTPMRLIFVVLLVGTTIKALTRQSRAEFRLARVRGMVTDEYALRQALIHRARAAIVALGRDDTAILATLRIRRLAPSIEVIATAREERNADLLNESGARSVIVSSETAGRLLGLATDAPETVAVVEDLLSFGEGLDLRQRAAGANEIGRDVHTLPIPVLALLRSGRILRYNDPDAQTVRAGDHLVYAQA